MTDDPRQIDLMAFIDLETTGTDEDFYPPIEIGILIVRKDEKGWHEEAGVNYVVHLDPYVGMPPEVATMHKTNGLLVEAWKSQMTIEQADKMASEFIFAYARGRHIPLAGSGVLHFDRRFIKRWMPLLDKSLTYWAIDVGVLRRVFTMCDVPTYDDEKGHRALSDAKLHFREFLYYSDIIRSIGFRP